MHTPNKVAPWRTAKILLMTLGISGYVVYDYVSARKNAAEARERYVKLLREQWDNVKKFPLQWDLTQKVLTQLRESDQATVRDALGPQEYAAFKARILDMDAVKAKMQLVERQLKAAQTQLSAPAP